MVEPAPLGSTVPGGFPQPQQKQQQQQQQQQLRLKAADVDLNDHNAFFEKHMPPQQGEIVEDQAGFHWEIDNVRSKLDTEKMVVSPTFNCRGHNWRLKWFPRGIHGNSIQSSIFVDYADAEEHKNERIGICIRYAVVLSAPDDFTRYNVKTSSNRISNAATDWGWADFIYYSDLFRSLPGYSGPFVDKESDKMFVHGFIQVINDPDGFRWADLDKINPRLDLGYVGLSNQGATCYMNSMLQSLFCTNALRKATYEIPVSIEELQGEKKSMTHALQRLFYQLQVSPRAVDTIELTRSFGWDDADAYLQHDVQEFNRVLQDNLETKMKGTVVEGAIEKFFVGKMKSYIKCINVDYESSRTENFYDIQLNVKGCNNLRDSFVEYISVETLDGDNQYMADGHGLQDARKGVVFESFPPVLHLQLKRFEYDFELDRMAKNNDRFEFPESIDLTQFLSEDSSQQKENNNYILHGVLVHAGSIDGGHYYAMLKPEKNGRWMKFDDDNVIPVSNEDAIERYFGGGSATDSYDPRMGMHMRRMRRVSANAYMLVYIRESHLDDILAPVTANDVPQHLLNVMAEQEALERQRREKAEMERLRREELQKNMTVRIVTSEMTVGHSGYDMVYFDKRQSRNNPVLTIRFPKHASIQDLRRYIVAQFYNQKTGKIEIPIRLWLITRRENQSLRPLDIPFEHNNTSTLTEQLVRTGINELRIFAELPSEINKVLPPIATSHTDGYYMMFAKYYNAEEHTLRGSGVVYVKNSDKIDNVKLRLNKLVGLKEDTPLTVWEEVVDRKLDPIVPDLTVKQQDSTSGDVLVFQIE
ncbi:cysteine proteinase, partial [Ramicandelaber brevisporus]